MSGVRSLLIAIFVIAAVIVTTGSALRPQEASQTSKPTPTFSVNVAVVNVLTTVRDRKGNFITDLNQEDFALFEDGIQQTIKYFSRETDLPLTVGLIVDATPSESNRIKEEKAASRVFLNKILRPDKDNAFLMQFHDDGVALLQGLTSSPAKIEKALNSLERGDMDGPRGLHFETLLSDAISIASNRIMKLQQGRKALIVIADGYHVGSHADIALKLALESDTLIYTIHIADPIYDSWGENLRNFSKISGGSYFKLGNKDLEQIYSKIDEELRSQYNLGYTPEAYARAGYRRIKVKVNRKSLAARCRDGYYYKEP
jgi:VWFA-related protein